MGNKYFAGLFLSLCLLSAGCTTTLEVTPLSSADLPPEKGIPYFLPFTQFEITVSRTLTQCPDAGAKPEVRLIYKTQVTIVSTNSEPDPAQEYLIDLTSLSNWWKTSDLKVSFYPGGVLQTFNASSADQTAQIAQNVLTGVGTIAGTVATDGLAPAVKAEDAKGAPAPLPVCLEKVQEALNTYKKGNPDSATPDAPPTANSADGILLKATNKLNTDTAALKALLAATPSMGTRLDTATQKLITDHVTLVNNDLNVQTAKLKSVSDYQKILTVATTFRWPLSGALDTPASQPATLTTAAVTATAQQVVLPGKSEAIKKWIQDYDSSVDPNPLIASIRLQRLPGAEYVQASSDTTGSSGIRFRVPARGQLLLCDGNAKPKSGQATANDKETATQQDGTTLPLCSVESSPKAPLPATTKATWEGMVPQLGRINFLPYTNRPFQSNVLSATFNADGTLASAEYQEPTRSGVSASGAFSAAATTAAQTANTISTAQTVKLGAQLAQIQAQNNLTSAEATAATANQASQLAQIQAQDNLISAQATQATASQVAQATANTTLLTALAAQANAAVALKTAQAALAQ